MNYRFYIKSYIRGNELLIEDIENIYGNFGESKAFWLSIHNKMEHILFAIKKNSNSLRKTKIEMIAKKQAW